MSFRTILYSNQRRHRLTRHLILWLAYALYFLLQSYCPTAGDEAINWHPVVGAGIDRHFAFVALLSTATYFPFCFFAAYALLYYLYPRFLRQGRFISFIGNFFLLILLGLTINYFTGLIFYRYSGRSHLGNAACFFLGVHNTTIAIITGLFILGLRLGRNAWLQQAANLRLAAQKARTELQLLKTRIDPRFLFTTLGQLRTAVSRRSPEAPAAILRLSETLSNILYEGEGDLAFSATELHPEIPAEPVFQRPAAGINRLIYDGIFNREPRVRLTRHIVFWLLRLWNLTFTIHAFVYWPGAPDWLNWSTAFEHALLELVAEIGLTYTIAYWLFPRFFERRKYKVFVLGTLALLIAVFRLTYPNQLDFHYSSLWNSLMNFIRMSFTTWLLFIAWRLFRLHFQRMTERVTLNKEKSDIEFQLLKAQVHPHFLFNTLNNIYSFALDGSPKAGELLSRLSSMMWYMIYDCEADRMPLDRELHLLEDYIGLEKARYGDRLDMRVSIEGVPGRQQIAPLLMIPFLENCFKHGASQVLDHPWVKLDIRTGGNQLDFSLSNNKPRTAVEMNGPAAALNSAGKNGIGLKNIRQRLELLYPNHYQLEIDSAGDRFSVRLVVPLEKGDGHGQ
jgi:sensor histidine kinase YesM